MIGIFLHILIRIKIIRVKKDLPLHNPRKTTQ